MENQFFLESPDFMLKIGKEGEILNADLVNSPLLESWNFRVGKKLSSSLWHVVQESLLEGNPKKFRLNLEQGTYLILAYPLPEDACTILYGFEENELCCLGINPKIVDSLGNNQEMPEKGSPEKSPEKIYPAFHSKLEYAFHSRPEDLAPISLELRELLKKCIALIVQTLGVEYCKVLELLPDGKLFLKAGSGWNEKFIGKVFVDGGRKSQAGYTLFSKGPVIVEDLSKESMFDFSDLFREQGIVSGVCVLIGNPKKPYGVLGVHSTKKRKFTQRDMNFLTSVADLIGESIEFWRVEKELVFHSTVLEELIKKRTFQLLEINKQLEEEITDRRRFEVKLRNNIQFLKTLLNTIPAPVFYKDSEGRYQECNELFSNVVMGLPKEEIIGRKLLEIEFKLSDRVLKPHMDISATELHRMDMELLVEGNNNTKNNTYESKIKCIDGKTRNFIVIRNPVRNEREEATGLIGVMLDITELRKTENALQNNISFLETLLDSIPSPVFQRDINGVYVNCNETFARGFLGLPKEKIIGASFLELQKYYPDKIKEIYWEEDMKFLLNGGSQRYDNWFLRSDNLKRDFLFNKTTYNDASGIVAGVVGVMTDITEIKQAEIALKNNISFLQTLLDSIPSPVFQRDINGIYVNCNEKFARQIMGFPKEEVIGKSYEEFKKHIPEELKEIYSKYDLELLEGKGPHYHITEVRCADGVKRDFYFSKATYNDASGNIAGVAGVLADITENKLAEDALKKSEARYRMAAEQSGSVVYDGNVTNGQVEWAGAIEKITGYTEEEFQQFDVNSWKEHLHPEDKDRVITKLRKYLQEGAEGFCEVYRLRRKDGSYVYMEDCGIFLKNEKGRIDRSIGVKKDITERKLGERKLQESEELYRSFVQNFQGIACHLDMNYSPIFVGGNVEKITGYRAEDFISGKIKWKDITMTEDIHRSEIIGERLKSVQSLTEEWEYQIRHKHGEIRWLHEVLKVILDDSGQPNIIQIWVYDITERKIAEIKLRKVEEMRKKEIHHRIKNNLQVISSLLELQSEKFEDDKIVEAFMESQNRVNSMAIIHENLYRSKDMATLDFAAYLEKLARELIQSYAVGNEDINLKLETENIFLGADTAVPIGIVINELISNSLKHAFPDNRKKEISIKLSLTEGGNLESVSEIGTYEDGIFEENNGSCKEKRYKLIIADNGIGFPKNIDFRNTGSLGLQLVNTLIDQLEGSLELENTDGTEFRITFMDKG